MNAGRGGAGNYSKVNAKKITSASDATGPASLTKLNSRSSSSSSHIYTSGRGGAGNMSHSESERPMFSFDEELERQRRMQEHAAPVYHVGRGGAGNWASEGVSRSPSHAGDAISVTSGQSVRNSLEGTWNRLRGSFGAHKD
jgi:hypothetical protein